MSTLYVDTINEKTSGNGIEIPGHVIYVDGNKLAADSSLTSTSTSFVVTGSEITVPAATVAKLSKIIVVATGSFRVNKNTHAFVDWKLERSAPSTSELIRSQCGVVSGGTEVYDQVCLQGIDSSLGAGDHTYKVYFRKADGAASYANAIYYNYKGWTITVMGVAK